MRGQVIRRDLNAQLVSLRPCVPHVASRLEASRLGAGSFAMSGKRSTLVFGRDAVPLEYLDQGLDLGIVVTPVRAHARRRGVGDRDSPVATQILVKTFSALRMARFLGQDRQSGRAALWQQDVAVTVRIANRTLVAVERLETPAHRKQIHGLLQDPVDVLVVGTALEIVLARQQIVQASGIEGVAVGLEQRAIVVAVHRELGVSMRVSAVDLVRAPLGSDLVPAQPAQIKFLGRRQIVRQHSALRADPKAGGLDRPFQDWQLGRVYVRVLVEEIVEIPAVHRPGRDQIPLPVGSDAPTNVLAAGAEGHLVRASPSVSIKGRRPNLPSGPMQRCRTRHVALADRAVPTEQPHAAGVVGDQLRKVSAPPPKSMFTVSSAETTTPG